MVTYILDGKARAHLPRLPLAVSMAIAGDPSSAALVARRGGDPDPSTIAHSPVLLIMPRVAYETLIVAVPGGGQSTFPSGTTIHVSIAVDSARDPDPDRAQLTPRDVSGLSFLELATIGPDGDRIAVTTRLDEPEIALGPLASRARAVARSMLGADQLLDDRQVALDVAIDTTLSMRDSINDGTVRAVVDMLAGISSVVSADEALHISLVGQRATTLPPAATSEVAARTQTALEGARLGVGFRTVSSSGGHSAGRRLTVIVSDSAPSVTPGGMTTAIVVSSSSAAMGSPGFTGAVVPPSPEGSDATAYLVGQPQLIDQVVAAVLAPIQHNEAAAL